jgi:bacterial/archaeal transporter family-2 protein
MRWFAAVFTFAAGTFITVQAGQNSQLKKTIRPLPALAVNYITGLLPVVIVLGFGRSELSALSKAVEAPWWSWFGGLSGALYGVSVVFFASQLGAASLTSLAVSGQLICSVVLDHYGWLGFEVHPASTLRIVGCLLMVCGFVLIAKF